MIKAWVNDINTTAFRIIASVLLACIGVVIVLLAIVWHNWFPTSEQVRVLAGLATVVLTMMGFDVLQFVGKRFSDTGYAAAKNPSAPSPVNVEAPSTVTVSSQSPDGDHGVPDVPHIPDVVVAPEKTS